MVNSDSNRDVVLQAINGTDADVRQLANTLGSSVPDEQRLALFVKDYVDDPDGYEELPFTRFYSDCIGKGIPIN